MENAIEIRNFTKYYGSKLAVDDISLNVPVGSIYGFIGPNGAGKTTTIRALMGLLNPSRGTARICGFDVKKHSLSVRKNVGYLPGEVRLFNTLNGIKTIKYLAHLRHVNCLPRARELAGIFELDLKLKIRRYSRGMRQKLGVILAMMHTPPVLIFDEPTSGLDPLVQKTLYDLLEQYARNGGTVFFSSHVLSEVEQLCDHVAVIRQGKLVADDTIAELRRKGLQQVRIVLKSGAKLPQPLPEGLRLIRLDGPEVQLVLEGTARCLADLLTTTELEYLTIAPPSLEEMFLRFYREGDPDDTR